MAKIIIEEITEEIIISVVNEEGADPEAECEELPKIAELDQPESGWKEVVDETLHSQSVSTFSKCKQHS